MDIEEIRESLRAAASDASRAADDAEDAASRAANAADEIREVLKALDSPKALQVASIQQDHDADHAGRDPLTDAEILWTQCGYHVRHAGERWTVLHAVSGQPVGEYGTPAEAQYVAYGCAMFGRPGQRS